MLEDDIYRSSTQYRLWSYTSDSLASLRSTTNALAAARVRDAIQRLRLENGQANAQEDVDCLTVDEEQKLVGFYCIKAMDFADFLDFPTNVKATAVQYLKRFYLSNSPMTYHPKQMMPSALFLSTKTENHYISLEKFVSKLPKTTGEDVVAPEFLLTQGLRFTFDVRHPQRGLEGGYMELLAMTSGKYLSVHERDGPDADLRRQLIQLEPNTAGKSQSKSAQDVKMRIQIAHGKAKEVLKTTALLTDVYFLYTPSQIWLAALLIADRTLARFYLGVKLSNAIESESAIMDTIQACANLLMSSTSVKPGDAEMKELTRIDKKLYKCRNPEKMDLVGINKAQKRDGDVKGNTGLDDKVIKKRKLENETLHDASVFGPSLTK